ncbi:MAG TPA: hypothetical protein VGL92_16525 [Acidimicrobiia bacterium]|jgi:hypothetical protein
MKAKLLVPILVVVAGIGAVVWWLQGGFGGPVSDAAARRYFQQIVAAAQAKDFDALCRLNSSVGACEFEMNAICRDPVRGGPLSMSREQMERECRVSVPSQAPDIVGSRDHPARGDYVGGRMLVVRGVDGRGNPYETEVLIFRDKRSYKAVHALFWSNDKFEVPDENGRFITKAEPAK